MQRVLIHDDESPDIYYGFIYLSKIIRVLILLLCSMQLHAQNVDSLKKSLKLTKADSNRVNVLNSLCWELRAIDSDSALFYGNEALSLAGKINFVKGKAMARCNLGIAWAFKSDYKNAERFLNESVEYFKSHDQPDEMATALFGLALTYEKWGDFTRSLDYYLQALQIREKQGDQKSEIQVLTSISNLYYFIHDYDNALSYAQRALTTNRENDDAPIANVRILCSMGNIYHAKADYEKALEYHKSSLKIARTLNKLYTVIALCNVTHSYLQLGNHREAKPYVEEALSMMNELGSTEIKAQVLRFSGWVFSKENRYRDAIMNYEEALALARSVDAMILVIDCYDEAGKIYAQTGNYRIAYQYSQRARVLNDSLRTAEVSDKIVTIQKAHELAKKQSQIDLLFQKNIIKELELQGELNRNYSLMISSGLLLFLVAFACYGFVMKSKLSKKLHEKYVEVQKQKELIEAINITLHAQALRASMNPHFIFNALSSIQYLIASNNNEEAFNYLSKFSVLLRKILDQGTRSTISVGEEIELLELYIELEALRFDHNMQYKIELPDQIRKAPIPSMMIQPYVENALIHGLFNKLSDRRLDIKLTHEQMKIVCQITDNGIGRDAALKLKASRGIFNISHGTELTKQRMEVQNNLNKSSSYCKIDDLTDDTGKPLGTRVTLTFDYV